MNGDTIKTTKFPMLMYEVGSSSILVSLYIVLADATGFSSSLVIILSLLNSELSFSLFKRCQNSCVRRCKFGNLFNFVTFGFCVFDFTLLALGGLVIFESNDSGLIVINVKYHSIQQ